MSQGRPEDLPLNAIRVDGFIQQRDGPPDEDYIQQVLMNVLLSDGEFEDRPIVFRDTEGDNWLAAGFRRVEAWKRVRKNVPLPCEVRDGEWRDALKFSSYGFKHKAERALGESVSNGQFIAAAVHAGVPFRVSRDNRQDIEFGFPRRWFLSVSRPGQKDVLRGRRKTAGTGA